jgi:hypothetical protein
MSDPMDVHVTMVTGNSIAIPRESSNKPFKPKVVAAT